MLNRRYSLPLQSWPVEDRTLWLKSLHGGWAAAWRPATAKGVQNGYGLWLSYLWAEGNSLLDATPEGRPSLGTIEGFNAWLRFSRSPIGALMAIRFMQRCLLAMCPDWDDRWLRRYLTNAGYVSLRRDVSARLQHPRELIRLGEQLMAEGAQGARADPRSAYTYRDGLIIALLAYRPVRRANLAGIRIGKELQRSGEIFLLRWDGHQTKSGRAVDLRFPAALVPALTYYLDAIRPRLRGANRSDALWPSSRGGCLQGHRLWKVITDRTEEAFGARMYPHLFRHAAATSMVDEAPEHAARAADLLGHRFLATTTEYYVLSDSSSASRGHTALICRLRDTLD